MNIERQNDELLPVDDPVTGKDKQKKHEAPVGYDSPKIFQRFPQTGSLNLAGSPGFAEEDQYCEEHQENAQRRNPKDVLDAYALMDPGRYVWSCGTANVH